MALVIGRIADIKIRVHYTWFIIFLLITWSVGYGLMPMEYPGLGQITYLMIGVLSSLLLFASILLHELAHSLVAKASQLKIEHITLFIFGGVAEMKEEPPRPALELKMAAAGPLTSIVLAIVAALAWQMSILLDAPPIIRAPLGYASLVNAVVAAFNLIPAFPLDGGRIFRAVLWMRSEDRLAATRTASKVGVGFGYLLMFTGIFIVFTSNFISGFWLLIIGWFLLGGARAGLGETVFGEALEGLTVSALMTPRVDAVSPDNTAEELTAEFLRLKHNGFPAMSGDDLVGCVTIGDLKKVPRGSWGMVKVKEIMTPREKLVTIGPESSAIEAFRLMSKNQLGRVFVLDGGKLVGIVTRSDVMRFVEVKTGR
ncbi:MAG: site-2 protease family protein [Thaumarchaeota archaeon]|nr:site-2 protease family protein [Nitrososphaerota archaeon]